MFAEGQIIAAHTNLDRVAQWREPDKLDRGSDEKAHFHEARPAFRREFYFGYGYGCAQRDRGQRLKV